MGSTVKLYDLEKPKISLSYWQIAALGIVPVVGFGAWYYYYKSAKKNKTEESKTQQNGLEKKITPEPCIQTSPKVKEQELNQSPLQRAQSIKDAGNKFFKEGKYADAVRCYSEAIELCPSTETSTLSTFYQNRAACHDQLNNLEGTVKDCTSALELNPKYTKALARRAKALQSLGRLPQCLEDCTAVCILENFQNQKSLEMADTVLKDLGKIHATEAMESKDPVPLSPYFVKSYFSSFPNDPVINYLDFEAVEVNNSSVSQNGESSVSHLERAKQLLLRGLYDEVIPACSEAVKHGEGLEPEALLLRATLYLLRGQHSLALQDLDTIISSEVQNTKIIVNALIKRASLHLQRFEKDETSSDFESAEKLDPNNPDLYLHRGQVNLLIDNIEGSIKDFKKCVSLDPNFAIAIMQCHYAEYREAAKQNSMSGIVKTVEKFKRDIRKFPKCSEGYILLAQILTDQQQYDEADKYFQSATEMDPTNATLRVHRGLLQIQSSGNVDAAINYINEAIQVDDKCSFCYETLGTIEVQRGNLKKAIELFNKSIPLTKTEMELAHIFALRDAAEAQLIVAERFGLAGYINS